MGMGKQCTLCRAKTPSTDEEEIRYLRPWVKKGKAWAQFLIGDYYRTGKGVKQSYEMAKRLYELAAQQGDVCSLHNLGKMYFQGLGVEQSFKRAKELWKQAKKLGHGPSHVQFQMMDTLDMKSFEYSKCVLEK